MDNIKNSMIQAKILKEDMERQKRANLKSLIKPYGPENEFKALQSFIKSMESPRKSYEYILNQRKDFNAELQKTQDNLERMRKSVAIVRPIDYIDGFLPTQPQYLKIYDSINKVNWNELYNSLTQSLINLRYPFIHIFLQPDEFSETLHEHVMKINDEKLTEIFTMNFLKKITRDW